MNTRTLPPDVFRAKRILAGHKQESLARALGCSTGTIRNYERGRTRVIYSIRPGDLARELRLDQVA